MDFKKKAKIALESGRVFNGFAFGAEGERTGELVFNTSMTGYQEIITDPSYKGQIVLMTYPLIGNYGFNEDDIESGKPFFEGFVCREFSRIDSNWRSCTGIEKYMKEKNIVGVEGIDTRAITKHVRVAGAMKAVISTVDMNDSSLINKAKVSKGLIGIDLVKDVTVEKAYQWNKSGKYNVIVIDCGVKFNILRILEKKGCRVTCVPACTTFEDIKALDPDGILLSNGPGDPEAVTYVIDTVKKLLGKFPIFGICLGHQILGLALGGKTYKLKFGHHGANHPVRDVLTGKISITSQNHGFNVEDSSLNMDEIVVTHLNLNDNTIEGMRLKKIPAFSVQFHPEASPGPHDAASLFDNFVEDMEKFRAKKK
ncbi:MAG: glutamine-hydrolyzing carbamoyl-phosphate synthase small subunit [Candidatus Aureabacteria bacterium]|nr:glutamine-hydrolyzing carbamoyl-phosphate synthase small subunit [Candidatus Auribacterota bacterium]